MLYFLTLRKSLSIYNYLSFRGLFVVIMVFCDVSFPMRYSLVLLFVVFQRFVFFNRKKFGHLLFFPFPCAYFADVKSMRRPPHEIRILFRPFLALRVDARAWGGFFYM